MLVLARFAERMQISMRLAFVNVASQTDGTLVQTGNVAVVILDTGTAGQLHAGTVPDFRFIAFADWLKSL